MVTTSDLKQKYCLVCFEIMINMVEIMTVMLMLMMTKNKVKQLLKVCFEVLIYMVMTMRLIADDDEDDNK